MSNIFSFRSILETCLDMKAFDTVIKPLRAQDRLLQIPTMDALDQSANISKNLCRSI